MSAQISGLEEEFELSAGLPRLMYVKDPAPDRDPRLRDILSKISQQVSYRHFGTAAELSRLLRDDLATLLSERFAAVGRPSPKVESAPKSSRARMPRQLPVDTTTLVGREAAIDEVVAVLGEPSSRLVTLTGTGGIGKTRLALAVAERVQDRYEAGTSFGSWRRRQVLKRSSPASARLWGGLHRRPGSITCSGRAVW
jgi:hypothetical protein